MLSVITLLVWAAAVLATPKVRLPWTALCVSWAFTAAVWVVAGNVGKKNLRSQRCDCQSLIVAIGVARIYRDSSASRHRWRSG